MRWLMERQLTQQEIFMRPYLSALLFTTFLAGPALAQATPPAGQPAQPPAKQQQATPPAAGQSGAIQFHQQQQPNQWSVQWLSGSNVFNRQDENLGSINDIILDEQGRAVAVVIGVGGFLGMGEKNVAVEFSALDIQPTPQTATTAAGNEPAPTTGQAVPQQAEQSQKAAPDEHRVYLNVTREDLKAAPEFQHDDAQRGMLGGAGSAR